LVTLHILVMVTNLNTFSFSAHVNLSHRNAKFN